MNLINSMVEPLLSVEEISRYLGISPFTVYRMAEKREMAREVWLLPQCSQGAGALALLMGRSL